jgi:hypothetical protein
MSGGATRIYEQRNYVIRQWISEAVLVLAMLYGAWELVASFVWPESANNAFFGVLFIAAGFYGLVRMTMDSASMVSALDYDAAGKRLVVTLWRPWGPTRIADTLDRFTDWRFYVSIVRRVQSVPQLRFQQAGRRIPFVVELKSGMDLSGLRQVAPDAVADYEERGAPPPA